MNHLRVAILKGGPGANYKRSLQSGEEMSDVLADISGSVKKITITKGEDWLEDGIVKSPDNALLGVDVVFLALSLEYAKTGKIQGLLQKNRLPFNGSRSLNTLLTDNDDLVLRQLDEYNVKRPKRVKINFDNLTDAILSDYEKKIKQEFGSKCIYKFSSTENISNHAMQTENINLEEQIKPFLGKINNFIVEEYIDGRMISNSVIEKFRKNNLYTFPVMEFTSGIDYHKYVDEDTAVNEDDLIYVSQLNLSERERVANLTADIHKGLGLSHYSRSDFAVRDGELYFLGVKSLPMLSKDSIFTKSAESVGLNQRELIKHILDTASV